MPAARATTRSAAPISGTAPSGTRVRPVVSTREAQALRQALALRQILAARPDVTPEQAAALLAARETARRTAAGGKKATARKQTARKPATGTAAARKAAARKPATRKSGTRKSATRRGAAPPAARRSDGRRERSGLSWPRRIGLAAAAAVLVPAVVSQAIAPTTPDPGQGPQDATSLALTAQSTMLEQAGKYRQLQQELAQRQAELQAARDAEAAAQAVVDEDQQALGASAADLYTATPNERYPLLDLDVRAPDATSGVLFHQALADRAARERSGAVVRAQRAGAELAAAAAQVATAEAAVAAVTQHAERILGDLRGTVDGLSTEVVGRLAALGGSPVPAEQQQRNQRALQRWQDYLADLGSDGIVPPPAAALADPAVLPAGFSPALDAAGNPVPGVAWGVVGNRPVTVLPAETVAAVSSALSQLGKPYVPGTAGPDGYDCGGFTAATWLLAGYALPVTPRDQWAAGTAVPVADLQVGDLVFSPGGEDVGLYLGDGEVLGASAGTYQVGVRSLLAESTAVRVTLGPAAAPNPAVTTVAPQGACGAPLPTPGAVSPSWGGWGNGQIPGDALCALGVGRHALRCDAAAAYGQMSAAYEREFGHPICITDSYRSLPSQKSAFIRKPTLAAVPGTSNHGWALAVDLCDGVNRAGSPQWTWMVANAPRFGWVQPDWARPGGEKPEPWHWEFGNIS